MKVCTFLNLHKLQWHFSLIVKFPGFIIAVMADQISTLLKRCILDEMYASLLYLKVISHVTLMFVYRE